MIIEISTPSLKWQQKCKKVMVVELLLTHFGCYLIHSDGLNVSRRGGNTWKKSYICKQILLIVIHWFKSATSLHCGNSSLLSETLILMLLHILYKHIYEVLCRSKNTGF